MSVLYIVSCVLAEILLVFAAAFFAGSETAYTSLSRITVRQMLKDKERNAKKVSYLRSNLNRLISTLLIGTNFVVTLTSSIATAFGERVLGSRYIPYVTALVSILVIIFSEIIPKTYAAMKPKQVAKKTASVIIVLQKILFPIVWLFSMLTKFLEFIESIFFKEQQPLITEDELKTLLEVGENEGTLKEHERDMLDSIFEFSDLQVSDVMRHRSLVKYINVDSSREEVVAAFAQSGYSRLPVYENDYENIVGVLHYKAVLFAMKSLREDKNFVRSCMRDVLFVPESLTAVELLQRFKKEHRHFAVALNEYGSMAGIVTMDDILREVFGRMTDEYGSGQVPVEKQITVVGTKEFIVPGEMHLEDVNDLLKLSLESEDFDTLGGWLLEKIGELPPIGYVYREDKLLFIVEDQSARRIKSVRICFL